MAAKEKFRIVVSEEDHDVILSICDTLNSLSDPKDQNGFSFNVKEDRLIISVYRCRNSFSSFEVALKTTSLDEEKLLALNALFRKCILEFQYDSDKNEIVISLPEEYTHTKEVQLDNSNENQEKISCIIALRKPFPMLKHIVSLLNLIKIKKVLTINQRILSISAIGRNIAINVKAHVLRYENMNLPAFCSKFNYLSALGLADFDFEVLNLNSSAELLQVTVFVPEDEDRRKKYYEIVELLNSISSFNEHE